MFIVEIYTVNKLDNNNGHCVQASMYNLKSKTETYINGVHCSSNRYVCTILTLTIPIEMLVMLCIVLVYNLFNTTYYVKCLVIKLTYFLIVRFQKLLRTPQI